VQGGYGMRFCNQGRGPIEQDVYRGTRFLGGWKFIPVHRFSKRAGVRSRYKHQGNYHGTRSKSKNHDKQLAFIDRVMLRRALIVIMKQSRGLPICPDWKEF
jgi:hypothetical protein